MKPATMLLDIVSAEKELFSAEVKMVFATGEMGELGIAPGHSQLLSTLRPGFVRALLPDDSEEVFYVSGGMLEVQPYFVTVLAETSMRGDAIDLEAAEAAKKQAEAVLAGKAEALDISRASVELAEAAAQIAAVRRIKNRAKGQRV